MSLFGDGNYQYRETFFVLFAKENKPTPEKLLQTFEELGPKYETSDLGVDENQSLESLTVKSPTDFSAMDIIFTEGEEVASQTSELLEEMRTMTFSGDDLRKLAKLKNATARFDIFHFEEIAGSVTGDDFLDPGGLLLVLERLCDLCDGVSVDPQSQSLL